MRIKPFPHHGYHSRARLESKTASAASHPGSGQKQLKTHYLARLSVAVRMRFSIAAKQDYVRSRVGISTVGSPGFNPTFEPAVTEKSTYQPKGERK